MQRVVRISPLDDILHIVEELAAVVMIDYAKYRPVVSFIFLGDVYKRQDSDPAVAGGYDPGGRFAGDGDVLRV